MHMDWISWVYHASLWTKKNKKIPNRRMQFYWRLPEGSYRLYTVCQQFHSSFLSSAKSVSDPEPSIFSVRDIESVSFPSTDSCALT